jgi:hypothetical protein
VILDIACVLHAQIDYTRIHVKPVSGSLGHCVLFVCDIASWAHRRKERIEGADLGFDEL